MFRIVHLVPQNLPRRRINGYTGVVWALSLNVVLMRLMSAKRKLDVP